MLYITLNVPEWAFKKEVVEKYLTIEAQREWRTSGPFKFAKRSGGSGWIKYTIYPVDPDQTPTPWEAM